MLLLGYSWAFSSCGERDHSLGPVLVGRYECLNSEELEVDLLWNLSTPEGARNGTCAKAAMPGRAPLPRLWRPQPRRAPVLISAVSSAESWHPCTMLRVQCERSLLTSALKRCVSIPCWVPVRVAKDRSTPAWGEPFPGPEWTSLLGRREK